MLRLERERASVKNDFPAITIEQPTTTPRYNTSALYNLLETDLTPHGVDCRVI